MGFRVIIRRTTCSQCGREFSALKAECPHCGARRRRTSARTPRSTDAVRKGTAASARAESGVRWQFVFGLCLVAAVIVSVIVLITTTLNGDYQTAAASPSPSVMSAPSASPTPRPTATPAVESVTITFLGQPLVNGQFATHVGNTTQLGATIYPVEIEGPVEWSSSNGGIITVDGNGLVTAVGAGWASVIARCYGAAAECQVWVQ